MTKKENINQDEERMSRDAVRKVKAASGDPDRPSPQEGDVNDDESPVGG